MKKFKLPILAISFLVQFPAFAQVQVDHPLQLTGNGSNARVSGIHAVIDSADAPNVAAIQNGSLIYAPATGNSNNFSITISPPVAGYQTGMVFNFISNQTVTGSATLNVNNLGTVPIKKNFNIDFSGCEIKNGQVVTVAYDGDNFEMTSQLSIGTPPTTANAGPDQLNVPGESTTLAANTPGNGTGVWSIISGGGGNVANPSSPSSTFSGVEGGAYVLAWTISDSCGSSTDSVNISFASFSISTTGANITYDSGYTYYTYTSSGTFSVSGNGNVDVLVVAGGGGGGGNGGGGGGGGGVVYQSSYPVSAGNYTVTVGAGGAGQSQKAPNNGENSSFETLVAIGGGGGGSYETNASGTSGGSGGGGVGSGSSGSGTANQGNSAGQSSGDLGCASGAGGGGGAGSVGSAGTSQTGGNGGNGINYFGNTYGGGGGGGVTCAPGTGGTGGSGGGANGSAVEMQNGYNGTNGLGGGGGGAGQDNGTHTVGIGGNGGSGVVIIRYYP